MAVEWPQLQTSACIHGCGFVAVTPGDEDSGEPKTLVQTMSASEATGVWDVRKRRLTSALWTPSLEGTSTDIQAVLFTEENTVEMSRSGYGGEWKVNRIPNPLKRCPVTLVALQPQLGRPFGKSRITRSVKYLTQMAARTLLRTEVGAEFYNAPQRWAMGANMDDFVDDAGNPISSWETVLGNIWLMGKDEEGDVPTVGQFAQQSMEPNVSMMRMITTLFAGETSLPVSSLGVIHDNPASAAAIDAAWADMTSLAELCQVDFGVQAVEIAQNMLMIERDIEELPKELVRLRPKWRDASTPTKAAMADAVTKEISAGVLIAQSRIALEKLGYDEAEIIEIQAEHEEEEKKKAERDPLRVVPGALNGEPDAGGDPEAQPGEPPAVESARGAVEPNVARTGPVPPRR
jgi:hypothetical protein